MTARANCVPTVILNNSLFSVWFSGDNSRTNSMIGIEKRFRILRVLVKTPE